ncbi:vitamin K epoxide reductase family protein [Maribacter aurantiacus]|nr:vitamin K epoxide reductase family protein [Maribacter aurantiacus]
MRKNYFVRILLLFYSIPPSFFVFILIVFVMEKPSYPILKMLINYSRKQNRQISTDKFKLHLLSNPSYPSIKSITDTLDYFSIPNIAAIIPKESLKELPKKFLASVEFDNQKHIAEVNVGYKSVNTYFDDGTKRKLTFDEFNKIWTGGVILIEQNEGKKFKKPYGKFYNPIIALILFTVLLFSVLLSQSLNAFIFTLLSISGLVIAYFIAREELGIGQPLTSKICNSTAINSSCNDVINSKSATLFGFISLSDAAVSYFLGTTLITSFLGFRTEFFLVLIIFSIPVILYSIYSQAFMVKKWCPLCLGISLIIILQFVLVISNYTYLKFNWGYNLLAFTIFSMIYFAWTNIKKVLEEKISLESSKQEFYKFKWDYKLFMEFLNKGKLKLPVETNNAHSITFGNPKANLIITGVTNPMCGFCSEAFKVYNQLLERYPNRILLNIVFNVAVNLENDNAKIAQKVIEIYKENQDEALKALQVWYQDRNLEKWQKKYGLPMQKEDLFILNKHYNWFIGNDIIYSPATIINSKPFPKKYNIEDLPMFIDHLLVTESREKNGPIIRKAQ